MVKQLSPLEIWFLTGSQHLYGTETLKKVAANARKITVGLSHSERIPLKVVFKPIVTGPEEVRARCLEANNTEKSRARRSWGRIPEIHPHGGRPALRLDLPPSGPATTESRR